MLQGDDQAVSGRTHEEWNGSVREAGEGSIKDYFGKAGKIVWGNTDGSDDVIDDDR